MSHVLLSLWLVHLTWRVLCLSQNRRIDVTQALGTWIGWSCLNRKNKLCSEVANCSKTDPSENLQHWEVVKTRKIFNYSVCLGCLSLGLVFGSYGGGLDVNCGDGFWQIIDKAFQAVYFVNPFIWIGLYICLYLYMFVYVYFHVYVHVSMVVFLSWCVSVFRHTRTSTFLLTLLQTTLLCVVTFNLWTPKVFIKSG